MNMMDHKGSGFLPPERSSKPRKRGLTAVIDYGPDGFGWTGERGVADLLDCAADYIDFAKIYAMNALLLPKPVVQRAGEILAQLEASSGKAVHINPGMPRQLALFPETNPLLDELKGIDMNALSPIEALNKLYEWKRKYLEEGEK